MNTKIRHILILFSLIFLLSVVPVFSDTNNTNPSNIPVTNEGIILTSPELMSQNQNDEFSVRDILPLLNATDASTPASLGIIRVVPGSVYQPSSISPGAGLLYILNGSAEISTGNGVINTTTGDAILIPEGSLMKLNNTGDDQLMALSAVSESKNKGNISQLTKRSINDRKAVFFGNESGTDRFSVTRLFSPFEESLPLAFDLAIVNLSAGNTIGNHFLESGETVYAISGTGNISIGCKSSRINPGDLAFVPQNVSQSFSAETNQTLLLITSPFYIPETDHPIDTNC